jgi:hypothetical protein
MQYSTDRTFQQHDYYNNSRQVFMSLVWIGK